MTPLASIRSAFKAVFVGALASAVVMIAATAPRADEGGVSFWVPGFFGSLAATPLVPGFSYANIYYHTSVNAGGDVAFARQVNRGNITANFSGNLNATINADVDLYMAVPSYTFAQPFLGGQATVLALIPYGRAKGSVDATLTGNLGLGGPGFTISGGRTDEIVGFGDVAGMLNVRWNADVHNTMAYVATNFTTGRYDPTRLRRRISRCAASGTRGKPRHESMDRLAIVPARRDIEIERVFLGIAAIRHGGSNQVSYWIDLIPGAEHALCIRKGRAQHEQRVADLLLARLIPIGRFEAPRTARLQDCASSPARDAR